MEEGPGPLVKEEEAVKRTVEGSERGTSHLLGAHAPGWPTPSRQSSAQLPVVGEQAWALIVHRALLGEVFVQPCPSRWDFLDSRKISYKTGIWDSHSGRGGAERGGAPTRPGPGWMGGWPLLGAGPRWPVLRGAVGLWGRTPPRISRALGTGTDELLSLSSFGPSAGTTKSCKIKLNTDSQGLCWPRSVHAHPQRSSEFHKQLLFPQPELCPPPRSHM